MDVSVVALFTDSYCGSVIGDKEQSVCSQLEEPSCYFILCSDERKHMR